MTFLIGNSFSANINSPILRWAYETHLTATDAVVELQNSNFMFNSSTILNKGCFKYNIIVNFKLCYTLAQTLTIAPLKKIHNLNVQVIAYSDCSFFNRNFRAMLWYMVFQDSFQFCGTTINSKCKSELIIHPHSSFTNICSCSKVTLPSKKIVEASSIRMNSSLVKKCTIFLNW